MAILLVLGVALSATMWSCAPSHTPLQVKPRQRPLETSPVDTGPGSLEATRRALEGTWTLISLEVIDGQGARRLVKASGQLIYDAFGSMTVRGLIEEAGSQNSLMLDYEGRIVIDPVRLEFYAADLVSDRPVNPSQIAPVSPDKVRRYELSGNSLVVTYLDASNTPTAVSRWQR